MTAPARRELVRQMIGQGLSKLQALMDFALDRTPEDLVLKCLTIMDDATHEAVWIELERTISNHGVARVLDRLA